MNNVKVYKNSNRNKPQKPYTPYVPQYQVLDKEPATFNAVSVPSDVALTRPEPLPSDNPRAKRPAFQQPLPAQPIAPQVTHNLIPNPTHNLIPNIGNNVEQVWSSIDGEIIDDMPPEIDPNQPFIDNNEFVTDAALGFQNGATAQDLPSTFQQQPFTMETSSPQELLQIMNDLEYDNYLLIVAGTPICSGPQEGIEEQARLFAFGEHETCENTPIPLEDIMIFKKAKIKVGLFLE
jgi:hypothetical protein